MIDDGELLLLTIKCQPSIVSHQLWGKCFMMPNLTEHDRTIRNADLISHHEVGCSRYPVPLVSTGHMTARGPKNYPDSRDGVAVGLRISSYSNVV